LLSVAQQGYKEYFENKIFALNLMKNEYVTNKENIKKVKIKRR